MTRALLLIAAGLVLAAGAACMRDDHGLETEAGAEAQAFERGPHRGRWLEDGAFALELTIFEQGVPPEFRAFAYRDEQPIEPSTVELDVTLRRLGGRIDRIGFAPRGDYLLGDATVYEPHSFDVEVVARESGREHRFQFSSYENRVTLSPEQRDAARVTVRAAEPATIRESVVLYGRIAPNGDALAHLRPRFPGVVRAVHKRLGDEVSRGDLLASIESNESLRLFELRAQLAGTVISKDIAPGEFVATDREVFQIADLSRVWVDLEVHRAEFGRLEVGQSVRVDAGDGSPPAETALRYLAPIGAPTTQTLLARAELENPDGAWRPGLFVTASVETAAVAVAVAVNVDALQRVRDSDVVFLVEGDVYEARPIELGRRDARNVEVLSGLAAGQRYVSAGSFVLKAEAGKSGATHDH